MFYLYTLFIPSLIIIYFFYKRKEVPFTFINVINTLFYSLSIFWIYLLIIYYLESIQAAGTGWATYSIFFFLAPITLVILLIKLVNLFTNRS